MNKFYVVAVHCTGYRVFACAFSEIDAAHCLKAIREDRPFHSFVIRNGATGERRPIADYMRPWVNELLPAFAA